MQLVDHKCDSNAVPLLGTKLLKTFQRVLLRTPDFIWEQMLFEEHECVCGGFVGTHGLIYLQKKWQKDFPSLFDEWNYQACISFLVVFFLFWSQWVFVEKMQRDLMVWWSFHGWVGELLHFWYPCSYPPINLWLQIAVVLQKNWGGESVLPSLYTMYHFSPMGIESLGAWRMAARALIHQIGAHVHESTGDPTAASFLLSLNVSQGKYGNSTIN